MDNAKITLRSGNRHRCNAEGISWSVKVDRVSPRRDRRITLRRCAWSAMPRRRKVRAPFSAGAPSLPLPLPLRVMRVDPANLGTADCKSIVKCEDGLDYAVKDGSTGP